VIRVERVALPAGLRAVAQRDADGILVIYVSDQLDSRQQRAAVMEAVRASRRAGWRSALPAGAGIAALGSARLVPVRLVPARLLAGPTGRLWRWLGRLAAQARARPGTAAGFVGATAAIIAGGVATGLVLSPAAGPQSVQSLGPRPGVSVSATAQPGGGTGPAGPGSGSRGGRSGGSGASGAGGRGSGGSGSGSGGTRPPGGGAGGPSASASPGGPGTSPAGGGGSSPPAGQTSPAPGPTTPVAAPTPAPSASPTSQPSPAPSSAPPSGGHTQPCVDLVVVGICL
jgi:hypothetical protein